jgi:hypothetical protein
LSVTIPNSVLAIEGSAFYGCRSLTSAAIPNGVTSIADFLFSGCTSLTNVTIPDSVTSIRGNAFIHCTNLSSVTMSSNVTSIRNEAFYNCSKLRTLAFGDKLTFIEYSAFSRSGLTSVTIPDSVTYIDKYVFERCISLTNVIIGKGVTFIGSAAFADCFNLLAFDVSPLNQAYSSREVGLFNKAQTMLIAFALGRGGVYSVPDGVTLIFFQAFSGSKLTSATIPASVTRIGDRAFADCTALASLYFEGNAPSEGDDLFYGTPFVTVFYRLGSTGWGPTFADRPTALWLERPAFADWSITSGLTAQFPGSSGEGDDPDGDGLTNRDEWFAGTDPTQRASTFELELTPRPDDLSPTDRTPILSGQNSIYFRSVPGHYYGLERMAALPGAGTLQAVRIASATQTRFVVPALDPRAFYRVLALP